MQEKFIFPKDFLWGASTSSHQVEGENDKNDWWTWERTHQPSERQSGHACDQWYRWPEDAELIKALGHNSHRLSLEWSRIEPTEGVFDESALIHYQTLLSTLQASGIKTVVTLHHFTNPKWMAEKGGWRSSCVVKYFVRYVERVVSVLGSQIDYLITINEPTVYAFMSYRAGLWPPQERSTFQMTRVIWNMAQAHKQAYTVTKRSFPALPIGIAHNVSTFDAIHKNCLREEWAASWLDFWNNSSFYRLTGIHTHDFLGINYYFHRRLDAAGRIWPAFQDPKTTKRPVSDLGWELYPEGLGQVMRTLKTYNKPILVTEHGLADADDSQRPEFIKKALASLSKAIQDGSPVIGYLHWSLLDNFEWADGFSPCFGLVKVDYSTQKRTPRPSAWVYKELIERARNSRSKSNLH